MNSMRKTGNRLFVSNSQAVHLLARLQWTRRCKCLSYEDSDRKKLKKKEKYAAEKEEVDFMRNAVGREIPDAILERYGKIPVFP